MLTTSIRTQKILAAILWYIGGFILVTKGGSLLIEAETLQPGKTWPWLAVAIGLFIGGLQAKYMFTKSCKKNLLRIDSLEEPKVWQFYRPGFFLALAIMIITGATLSRLAHGNYPFLISVGILDISLATALLGSSYVFWKLKAFAK
jgi:hypothetical protein